MEITASPCVKICTYDAEAGLCRGCGRTLAEIAAWTSMTALEREKLMAELPERLKRSPAS
ncbi:MAG TPA: DUF1289 domain-containing protein [Rhizomicrobium sp.]|jgi:hypothetical protein|nr:DUF1289 domain-containing protein [Rhizomicrobium sp.]